MSYYEGLTYVAADRKVDQEEPWRLLDWLAEAKHASPEENTEHWAPASTSASDPKDDQTEGESKPDVSGLSPKEKRRIWNRENARKSRERKKLMVQSMLDRLERLKKENHYLKGFLQANNLLGEWHTKLKEQGREPVDISSIDIEELKFETLPQRGGSKSVTLGKRPADTPEAGSAHIIKQAKTSANTEGKFVLDYDDYTLMENVHVSQRHFLITDPSMPDNPIVFASSGFYELTQYAPSEILGRNCRLLQGKDSDPNAIKEIHEGIEKGEDVHCVLRNYRKDGTPFWNDLFIAPLRSDQGDIVHFIGVQCQISEERAKYLLDAKAKLGRDPRENS